MPEETPRRCDFIVHLIVKVDMTLAGDVKAIDPAVEKIMSAVREMSCGEGKHGGAQIVASTGIVRARFGSWVVKR